VIPVAPTTNAIFSIIKLFDCKVTGLRTGKT